MNNVTKNKNIKRKEEKRKSIFYIHDDVNNKYLSEFLEYSKNQNLAKETIYVRNRRCVCFLNYLETFHNININSLAINIIDSFVKETNDYSLNYKKSLFKDIRLFLKFLYKQGYLKENFSLFIPSIQVSGYNKNPNVYKDEEIIKIFNVIDRNNIQDKKIYLILLLVLRYGLRLCDIKNLKFENINWKEKEISIIQTKTKTGLILPLLEDIADALIDYIKNARPDSKESYILVNQYGKRYDLNNSHYTFYREFNRLIKKANIKLPDNQSKGVYSLRHTLASRLLKENTPLPIISSILGHTSIMSTMNYIKIDYNQLSKCCLNMEDIYE